MTAAQEPPDTVIRDVRLRGAVQGVGFRPHVYRLARQSGLDGWVRNDGHGVEIRVAGAAAAVERFIAELTAHAPPAARITECRVRPASEPPPRGFVIEASGVASAPRAAITPDMATCPDCLRELCDPADRRHRYPFINCTQCGPRYSIIEALPYDRPQTTMCAFVQCPACRAEYEDPAHRRFHAQPNACPVCGPRLAWWEADGLAGPEGDAALERAVERIHAGAIVAVKGLGGFHLLVDAQQEDAVQRLRRRKAREAKPLAVMFPSLAAVRAVCAVTAAEAGLLVSPQAPIVLLSQTVPLAPAVAPGNPLLGAMLPYTPLHHLLLRALDRPVVATSGNRADEPISTDEHEALDRLHGIADGFLVHNRPIARPVDDSVVRFMAGRPQLLRRARGYAPAPIALSVPVDRAVLAVGGHLKNTVTLALGDNAFMSQHLGDLDTEPAQQAFRDAIRMVAAIYGSSPDSVAADRHPDYSSTAFAREREQAGARVKWVQHHHAHVVACMADNGIEGPVLGVAWDGTGYGPDGTVWGGEFLYADACEYERAAWLRPFLLPGGDQAARSPARSALGVLFELYGADAFAMTELPPVRHFDTGSRRVLQAMLEKGLQSPRTSSAGRLFDAVAALLDVGQDSAFEGQAAMELEFAAAGAPAPEGPVPSCALDGGRVDWAPLLQAVIDGVRAGTDRAVLARRFHAGMAQAVVEVAAALGRPRVVLSGGCFQNRLLLEAVVEGLQAAGMTPFWHRHVPPNDGGLSLGQAVVASRSP